MINNFRDYINTYLKNKGFTPPIQKIIKLNGLIVCVLFCSSLVILPVNSWLFWLSCGAILSFWNFFFLAYFVQKMFDTNGIGNKPPQAFMVKQIIISNLRLCITGIFLYTFLVVWNADPFALIIGLSVSIAIIPILLVNNEK